VNLIMDKTLIVFIVGFVIINVYIFIVLNDQFQTALTEVQAACDNMTPEMYNTSQYHEMCKYNETTGRYDVNIEVWSTVNGTVI
jgi:uncharacterized protein YoxC